mgnify:CR=1 FL=1
MKKFVTISSVKTKTLSLIEKHSEELKDIDFVVAIHRGGMIPASLIASKLDKLCLVMYQTNDKQFVFYMHNIMEGKKVLLVDDICRTGKTMFAAVLCLKQFTAGENIKVLTVFDVTSIDKTVHPQITHKTIEDIQLPWDYE